jgi:hypothetical protein
MVEEEAACREEEPLACSRCSRLRFLVACLRLEEEEEECEQVWVLCVRADTKALAYWYESTCLLV